MSTLPKREEVSGELSASGRKRTLAQRAGQANGNTTLGLGMFIGGTEGQLATQGGRRIVGL